MHSNPTQDHSDGLASRLRQRDAELAEAAALMTETRQDLTVLRNRAKESEQVRPCDPAYTVQIVSRGIF